MKDVSVYELMNGLKKMDKTVFQYLCKENEIIEKDNQYLIWSWESVYIPLSSEDFDEFLTEFNEELQDD